MYICSSVPSHSTKSEKLDSEIEEIAKKIKEANDKKMVQIRSYPMFHNNQTAEMKPANEVLSEDWTSIQGQFGWTELSDTMIPYLTRSGQKYVCLRMTDSKVFLKYRQLFSDEIRNCFQLEKLQITKAEAALLNEINIRHCDNSFGRVEFTTNDGIASLDDVQEMYDFLEFCYTRLVEKNTTPHKRCGFIRIASQNFVPYVWYDDRQYVPLFYFEGECKYLEDRSIELRGWELAYLKLACKIQGIRKALFDNDSIRVVEMDLVKKFFPPDTPFDWMWPVECNVDSLMQKPILRIVPVDAETHKKLGTSSVGNNQELANKKRIMCFEKKSPLVQKKSIQVNSTLQKVPPSIEMSLCAQPTVAKNSTTHHNGLKPSPACPSTNKTLPQQTICLNQYVTSSFPSSTDASGTQYQQRPEVIYVNKPSYPPSSIASNVMAYKQSPQLRTVSVPNNSWSKILQIPDFICNSAAGCPYFLVRSQVENKQLNCINMEPYLTTILLVTLEEVATSFFRAAVEPVVNAVNVMRLDIFLPNKLQIRCLERSNKYPTMGLIKYKDFIDNIPQIRYILSSS